MDNHVASKLIEILAEREVPAVLNMGHRRDMGFLRFGASMAVDHHPAPETIILARQYVLESLVSQLTEYFEVQGKAHLVLLKDASRYYSDAMLPEDPLYYDIECEPAVPAWDGIPSRISAQCYCRAAG